MAGRTDRGTDRAAPEGKARRPFILTPLGIAIATVALASAAATLVVVIRSGGSETFRPDPAPAAQTGGPAPSSTEPGSEQPAPTSAPPQGLIAEAYVTAERNGPRTESVSGPVDELWAFFVFSAVPQDGLAVYVRWRRPDGVLLDRLEKRATRRIIAQLRDRERLAAGVWHALLYVDGDVVEDVSARVTSG